VLEQSGLEALTPLGHAAPEVTTIGPFAITERTDTALASLAIRRGRAADVTAAAATAGIPLPAPGHHQTQTLAAFWLAPEMWMIEAPFATHEDIRAHLLTLFHDAASITEQTDAWVRLDLTGDDLPALMERLCNVDLRAAPAGHATRTVIDHLGCYLIKHSDQTLTLYGPRSSAQTLHHALTVAAQSLA
jgi:sarcosine oxidase subunit gamma